MREPLRVTPPAVWLACASRLVRAHVTALALEGKPVLALRAHAAPGRLRVKVRRLLLTCTGMLIAVLVEPSVQVVLRTARFSAYLATTHLPSRAHLDVVCNVC